MPDYLKISSQIRSYWQRENQAVAQGFSSKQIAVNLEISKHTVDTYRRNLLRKTGSKNTPELVRYFD